MKLLAVSDPFIPEAPMTRGLAPLKERGIDVTVRPWPLPDIETLQNINLAVERGGPEAIPTPLDVFDGAEDTEILVVQFFPVPRAVFDKLPNLKLVCVLRGGLENIDLNAAKEKGVTVLNTPGRNARAVAEFTVGMMLAETRNIARCHAAMKKSIWLKDFPNSSFVPEISGKTIGFVGFGHIGKLVAQFLSGFGCTYLIYDPFIKDVPEGARIVPLDELMRESDIITIHARLLPETHHLVGEKQIALMKQSAVIVNTARSGLLDQDALVRALREKRITGAALDVFDREPIPEDDPIMALDNVTMTSHAAGTTDDAFYGSPVLCAGHIGNWLDGKEALLPRVA